MRDTARQLLAVRPETGELLRHELGQLGIDLDAGPAAAPVTVSAAITAPAGDVAPGSATADRADGGQ